MCSSRLARDVKGAWERECTRYDYLHDVAVWQGDDPWKSVRYNTITAQCGLFSWNCFVGKWIMEKELPVVIHDPVEVRHLAEKELR